MSDPTRPAPAIEGSLGTTTVAHLLAEAWRDRRSGTLRVSRDQADRHIHVHEGSPVAVDSNAEDEGFALMLESKGLIRAVDRLKVEEIARNRECPQMNAVLALRLLDASQLYKAIRTVSRVQMGETFAWPAGFYRWDEAAEDLESKGKPHDILSLLQEELPTRWGFDRLIQELMPDLEAHGDISPRFRRVATKLAERSDAVGRAISGLDGSKNLGQILGEAAGDPVAAATLWILLHSGILRVGGKRALDAAVSEEVEFEFEVKGATRLRSGTTTGLRAHSESPDAASKKDAKAEALSLEIASLLARLSDLNHYDALGLSEDATGGEIKRAYFKAAKKFHPDALARLGLSEESDDAAKVFGRIAEAFETLADDSKRAAYDSGGSDEPEIDTARLTQAETSFRKGEILLRMGNFLGALDYLEPAVDLWPEEPAYQCALGWALYKQPTPDTTRAREHLEMASSQSTDDAVALFRLGVVLRAMGDTKEASELIARARAIEPSIDE